MKTTKRTAYLLHRYLQQQLDATEWVELEKWIRQHPANRQLLEEITDEASLKVALKAYHEVYGIDEALSLGRMRRRIQQGIVKSENKRLKIWKKNWLPYVAASILFVFVVMGYQRWFASQIVGTSNTAFGGDALPGGNRATLSLPDGRTIPLDTKQGGIIMSDGLTYEDGAAVLDKALRTDEYNERLSISTPNGGQYQVILADGTRVWLNSASTLHYPAQFKGQERVVELEGEAFFEVKPFYVAQSSGPDKLKQQTPFIVKTKDQTVQVLGTQFNISAYKNEAQVKTTLVTGAVKVSVHASIANADQDKPLLLKPGEQSVIQDGNTTIAKVNLMSYIGWRKGLFYFDETPLADAMNQLSRWYDIEVVYADSVHSTYFYGEISRSKSLSAVLEILQEGGVNFKIEKENGKNKLMVY